MDPGAAEASGAGEGPSSSSGGDGGGGGGGDPTTQAAEHPPPPQPEPPPSQQQQQQPQQPPSRYESQKRRDWNTFLQYLKNHKPPLTLPRCSGAHVIEFLKYLDQFGKTKVHAAGCPYFGHPNPPAPCACPLKQAWGSLDALIGRLRAAYEENGGRPESNPFAARPVRFYLREVRESQAKARGIPYEKKKRKRNSNPPPPPSAGAGAQQPSSSSGVVGGEGGGGESSSTATAAAATPSASTSASATGSTSGAGEGSGAPPPEGSSTS